MGLVNKPIPEPIIDSDILLEAILSDDKDTLVDLLTPFSDWESNPLSGIRFLKNGHEIHDRLIGMQLLAGFLRNRGDLITATALAIRVFRALERTLETHESISEELLLMAGNNLDVYLGGITEIGNPRQVVEDAEHWIKLFRKFNKPYYIGRIRLTQVEALILGGEYEQAKKTLRLIDEEDHTLHESLTLNRKRLERKIPDLLRSVDEEAAPQPEYRDVVQEALPFLKDLIQSYISDSEERPIVQQASPIEEKEIEVSPDDLGRRFGYITVRDMDELTEAVENLPLSRNPNGALMGILQTAGSIMQDKETGHKKDILSQIEKLLSRVSDYARNLEFWESMIQSEWLRSVALRRKKSFKEASQCLQAIRDEIDKRRFLVEDPKLRAALIVYLPRLYNVSAEVLYELGKGYEEELFHVIEGAKSKILGDLIQSRHITPSKSVQYESAGLREHEQSILSGVKETLAHSAIPAHYVTFLIGDTETYVVLIDNEGNLITKSIDISRAVVEDAVTQLEVLNTGKGSDNPAQRGKIDHKSPWNRPYDPVIEKLSPISEWFSQLFEDGTVGENHIICYSPDGPLFNFPIQMLKVNEKPLVSYVGLSCIPSAEVLLQCVELRKKNPLKNEVFAVIVPLGEKDPEPFAPEIDSTEAEGVPVNRLNGKDADVDSINTKLQARTVIHFATHGHFDEHNPLRQSGLSVGHNRILKLKPNETREQYLLTPSKMEAMNFAGSHITFRACVSGQSTEITSREALGMLWASFQAGSVSVLAATWSPSFSSASILMQHFYDYWLKQRKPIWKAHQLAMQKVMNINYTFNHPYHWSSFQLYGYWV